MDGIFQIWTHCFLTLLVQEELVESQTAGLFADEAVHVLGAVVVNGDGVLQRLNAGLQTERNLGVANSVPEEVTRRYLFTHVPLQKVYIFRTQLYSQLAEHAKNNSFNNNSVVPLSIDGAQGDGPQVWAEASQLRNVVCHLQHQITHTVPVRNISFLYDRRCTTSSKYCQ